MIERELDFSPIVSTRINSSVPCSSADSTGPVLYGFHNAQQLGSLSLFAIDSLTGDVRVVKPHEIDREAVPQHILTIKARDPHQLYSFVRLVVNVEDTNDVGPVFFQSSLLGSMVRAEVRVPESTAVGTLITQVEAFDPDGGENGRLTYSIIFGNTGSAFGMEQDTGYLYVNRPLFLPPGKTLMEYQLTVKAADGGKPQAMTATTNINVVVSSTPEDKALALRCDDDEVQYGKSSDFDAWVYVKENAVAGSFVTRVKVDNSDSVRFEIENNGRNIFWIDPTTGVIFVGRNRGLLDRETQDHHNITVKATNMVSMQ